MQIDLSVTTAPADPVQKILDIAKVTKSEAEAGDFRYSLEERPDNQPINCRKLSRGIND